MLRCRIAMFWAKQTYFAKLAWSVCIVPVRSVCLNLYDLFVTLHRFSQSCQSQFVHSLCPASSLPVGAHLGGQ